jgi:transposase
LGFSGRLIAQETGVSQQALSGWVHLYQQFGEEGLKAHTPPALRQPKLAPAVTAKILELKQDNPTWGIKRISQLLRRFFFMKASPETVRQKLHQAQLMSPPSSPRRRNLTRPRFFERATPNQMWQSDIFTFRLGGRYAYLIAFLDDYSRFVTGAELFRSPTAQAVIEVYRQAIAEFKPPKEMLTDNGRQYTAWRGTSRFEAELKKDGVAHFKSRPHHPMTLGKIERFWETLWQHFLTRAQFDSFDAARERIKLWIKHYNHRRPHQGFVRRTVSLRSSRSCARPSRRASRITSWRWPCGASRARPSTWSAAWRVNRWCCAPRRANSNWSYPISKAAAVSATLHPFKN